MKPEVLRSWSLEIVYSRASRAPCLGADQKVRGLWKRGLGHVGHVCKARLSPHLVSAWAPLYLKGIVGHILRRHLVVTIVGKNARECQSRDSSEYKFKELL